MAEPIIDLNDEAYATYENWFMIVQYSRLTIQTISGVLIKKKMILLYFMCNQRKIKALAFKTIPLNSWKR